MTGTEKTVAGIWASLIPHVAAKSIDARDSFFDLGGHSIIAQQMLLKVRKDLAVDIPMSTVFKAPTLEAFSREIDRAKDPIGLRLDVTEGENGTAEQDEDYAADAIELTKQLPESIKSASLDKSRHQRVLLTGATGFLGSFIIRDLLGRNEPVVHVIAHVRAKDEKSGLERVITNCKANGIWKPEWSSRLQCVAGDLAKPNLGLAAQVWHRLTDEIDVVIHNGARVVCFLVFLPLHIMLKFISALGFTLLKPKSLEYFEHTSRYEAVCHRKAEAIRLR